MTATADPGSGPCDPAEPDSAGAELVVYTDGGSRGNPGPAGYGAVVLDAAGRTLAERSAFLGTASNNVAEYCGVIAGLQAAGEFGVRRVAVRMDSKLVVEQLSGRWKVKHPDLTPLAGKASELIGRFEWVQFDWIPRAQNGRADRLANAAMDAGAAGAVPIPPDAVAAISTDRLPSDAARIRAENVRPAGVPDPAAALPDPHPNGATRLLVIRHGETTWGAQGRFAGREDVPLTARGRRQAASAGARLRRLAPVVVLTSPLRRCRMTADAIGRAIGAPVIVTDALLDGTLGDWTGFTSDEIAARWPDEFAAWRQDPGAEPPGGESFTAIRDRVEPLLGRVIEQYPGQTVVLVTHAAPAKMILVAALQVPSEVAYRLRVDTASLSGITVDQDGRVMVWAVNETGHLPE